MTKDQQMVATGAIDAVIERAIEVVGDREEALRWVGTPVRAGKFRVLDALARPEHGIA